MNFQNLVHCWLCTQTEFLGLKKKQPILMSSIHWLVTYQSFCPYAAGPIEQLMPLVDGYFRWCFCAKSRTKSSSLCNHKLRFVIPEHIFATWEGIFAATVLMRLVETEIARFENWSYYFPKFSYLCCLVHDQYCIEIVFILWINTVCLLGAKGQQPTSLIRTLYCYCFLGYWGNWHSFWSLFQTILTSLCVDM